MFTFTSYNQGQSFLPVCMRLVNDPDFFRIIENKIHELDTFPIIKGGDFNQVMGCILDRKPPHLQTFESVNILKEMCEGLGITDIWQILNPTKNDYTFYSHPHNVT